MPDVQQDVPPEVRLRPVRVANRLRQEGRRGVHRIQVAHRILGVLHQGHRSRDVLPGRRGLPVHQGRCGLGASDAALLEVQKDGFPEALRESADVAAQRSVGYAEAHPEQVPVPCR